MTLVSRYICRQILGYFVAALFIVVFVYLAIDFFARIDKFLAASARWESIGAYFLLKTPLIISQMIPLCLLLAVLVTFGLMKKNNELTALESCGINPASLLRPVFVIGISMSVALFIFSEVVVPISTAKANMVSAKARGKKRYIASVRENIWIRFPGGIFHARFFDPKDKSLLGVTIYEFDQDFRMTRRYDARRAAFQKEGWVLYSCMVQQASAPGGFFNAKFHDKVKVGLDISPKELSMVEQKPEEMSFLSLAAYIRRMEAEGYDASRFKVDLWAKTAFPGVCLIVALIGAGIPLRRKRPGGTAASFAYGIIVAFSYWTVYSFFISLGYGGIFPPWLSAWGTNILFLAGAGFLLLP